MKSSKEPVCFMSYDGDIYDFLYALNLFVWVSPIIKHKYMENHTKSHMYNYAYRGSSSMVLCVLHEFKG